MESTCIFLDKSSAKNLLSSTKLVFKNSIPSSCIMEADIDKIIFAPLIGSGDEESSFF